MAHDRRIGTRDMAMQELAAIDLELIRPFIPAMRTTFRHAERLISGAGGAAMWRLARLRDSPSATLFRIYAVRRDPRWYDHGMPMVLADYIDDPRTLVRRIAAHDHPSMFWLATATHALDPPDGEQTLRTAASELPDSECQRICREELDGLLRDRLRPKPTWDIETEGSSG